MLSLVKRTKERTTIQSARTQNIMELQVIWVYWYWISHIYWALSLACVASVAGVSVRFCVVKRKTNKPHGDACQSNSVVTNQRLMLRHEGSVTGAPSDNIKDGAYYCYCAYILRILKYSDFPWIVLTYTGIFLRSLKLCGESRTNCSKCSWYPPPKKKMGVTVHFSEIIKFQFGKNCHTLLYILALFRNIIA